MIYIDQIVRPRVRQKKIILNTITKCWVIFGWEFRVIKHILNVNTLGSENSPQEGTILSYFIVGWEKEDKMVEIRVCSS
jgi:hypothetical protein